MRSWGQLNRPLVRNRYRDANDAVISTSDTMQRAGERRGSQQRRVESLLTSVSASRAARGGGPAPSALLLAGNLHLLARHDVAGH